MNVQRNLWAVNNKNVFMTGIEKYARFLSKNYSESEGRDKNRFVDNYFPTLYIFSRTVWIQRTYFVLCYFCLLVRAENVGCPWALQRNKVSTIYTWDYFSFLSFSDTYFSPRWGCPRVMKFCTEF
jgi:hypothetical protein